MGHEQLKERGIEMVPYGGGWVARRVDGEGVKWMDRTGSWGRVAVLYHPWRDFNEAVAEVCKSLKLDGDPSKTGAEGGE